MTPIKQFSNQIKALTTLAKSVNVSMVALNKTEPQFRRYSNYGESSYTKGVESDHIKIYKLDLNTSFAFSFYWQTVEKPLVMVSYKVADNQTIAKLSIESFREKLNQLVKIATILQKSQALSATSLGNSVKATFIQDNELVLKTEVAEIREKISEEAAKLKAQYHQTLENKKALTKELSESKAEKKAQVEAVKVKNKLKELQNKVDKIFTLIEKTEKQIDIQLDIPAKERLLRKLESDLFGYNSSLTNLINKHSSHLPKSLREEILKEFQK